MRRPRPGPGFLRVVGPPGCVNTVTVPCHPLFGLFTVAAAAAVAFPLSTSVVFTGSVMSRIAYVEQRYRDISGEP
jgi:hypothetical protein